jgi:hypothetical protein
MQIPDLFITTLTGLAAEYRVITATALTLEPSILADIPHVA